MLGAVVVLLAAVGFSSLALQVTLSRKFVVLALPLVAVLTLLVPRSCRLCARHSPAATHSESLVSATTGLQDSAEVTGFPRDKLPGLHAS